MGHSSVQWTVIAAIFAYFCLQALSFSLFKTGADIDTAELMLYIQSYEWGYGGSQPPFFNWVARFVTQLFGINLVVLAFSKFFFLALTLVFLYLSSRKLELSAKASILAVMGVFLMPELGWETQRSLTHSIPMLSFCAIGFFCFLAAHSGGSWLAYLGFGLCLALAILSKYNGGLFFVALLIAALSITQFRAVVMSLRMFTAIGFAALLLVPHGIWAFGHLGHLTQRADKFAIDASAGGDGIRSFVEALLSVAGPIILILLIVLVIQFLRRSTRQPQLVLKENLPLRTVFSALALIMVLVLVSGSGNVLNRWLSPSLLLFPMGVALWLDRRHNQTGLAVLTGVSALMAVLYAVALPLSISMGRDDAARRSMLNYEEFWDEATENEGPVCSVLTNEYAVFGNLKLVEPDLQLAHTVYHAEISHQESCGMMLAWRGSSEVVPDQFALVLEANNIAAKFGTIRQLKVARVDDPDDFAHFNFVIIEPPAIN